MAWVGEDSARTGLKSYLEGTPEKDFTRDWTWYEVFEVAYAWGKYQANEDPISQVLVSI